MMVLGGGGYTVKNVSRCWTYETAICLNEHKDIEPLLPTNDYYEYYGPDHELFISKKNDTNQNSDEYIQYIISKCLQNLKEQEGAPNVPFMEVPPDFFEKDDLENNRKTNDARLDEEQQQDLGKLLMFG